MRENGSIVIFLSGVGAVVIACVAYFVSQHRRRTKILAEVYDGRAPLDDNEFYDTYFSNSGTERYIVSTVKRILDDEAGVAMSGISPYEDFSGKLAEVVDGYDFVEAVIRIEEEFKITITDEEAVETRNLEQLVSLVSNKANS